MVLSLIGMRGTGKTSVGRLIAARLGWTFLDADAQVERTASMSIAEIFAAEGETGFRRRERDVMRQRLGSTESLVIATGGGAILDTNTRNEMREAGPVVWLTAPTSVLADRLSSDSKTSGQRPSLTGKSVSDELEEVLRTRRAFYQQVATITVPTDGHAPDWLADDIIARLAHDLKLEASDVLPASPGDNE